MATRCYGRAYSVSARLHAATLVTAGLYLLLRSSPVIESGPTTLIVITWVGALTAFFATYRKTKK